MALNKYNELSKENKIGDIFDPKYYIVWKNDIKPRELEPSRGYHPNAINVTVTLYITSENDNYWIFNDGEYKARKSEWNGLN